MTRLSMSAKEYQRLQLRPRKEPTMPAARKYRNILTVVDGKTFDSKAEARRYRELKLMQQAGEISGFGEQPSFIIGPEIRYRPDFIVCDRQGQVWVEDVKGKETAAFVIKAKLFRERYPWLPLKIIK